MRRVSLLFSLFALFAFAHQAEAGRSAPLVDPEPVTIPSAVSDNEVLKSIKLALVGRGWQVTTEQPGEILSTLELREHVAKIKVTWDAKDIRIAYVDSTNLDYKVKRGKPQIHANYLNWINYVIQDLNIKLRTYSVENGGSGR